MSKNLTAKLYKQYDKVKPSEAVKAVENDEYNDGQGDQLLDLDETYDDKDGHFKNADLVNSGLESLFTNGTLDYDVGKLLKIKGNESLSFGNTVHNAVVGCEGFFSSIKDTFINFVKWVIDLVKTIVNWIKDKVLRLLGVKRSDLRVEEINNQEKELKEELEKVLRAIGVTDIEMGIITDNINADPRVVKMLSDVNLLVKKDPLTSVKIQELIEKARELKKTIDKTSGIANKARNDIKRDIDFLMSRAKKSSASIDAGEFLTLCSNMNEKIKLFNISIINSSLKDIYNLLNIEGITEDNLSSRHINIFKDTLKSAAIKNNITPEIVKQHKLTIDTINNLAVINDLNFSPETIKDVTANSDLLSINDADTFLQLGDRLVSGIGNTELRPSLVYRGFTNAIKDYYLIIRDSLTVVNLLTNELTKMLKWRVATETWLATGIVNSIEEIKQLEAKMHKEGILDPNASLSELASYKSNIPLSVLEKIHQVLEMDTPELAKSKVDNLKNKIKKLVVSAGGRV